MMMMVDDDDDDDDGDALAISLSGKISVTLDGR